MCEARKHRGVAGGIRQGWMIALLICLTCLVVPVQNSLAAGFSLPWVDALLERADAWLAPRVWNIPRVASARDTNGNGINDTDDLIAGAREEAKRRPAYRSAYYKGGFPPPGEGVCTDVIWRSFRHAGYDLKRMIDKDIRANPRSYSRAAKPDSNIDFRRVPNQKAFFARHGTSLTTRLIPGDEENLKAWQPGDIVIFTNPDHIAILSDKRNKEGVPFLLHNDGPWASEADDFMYWYGRGISGHYRFPPD